MSDSNPTVPETVTFREYQELKDQKEMLEQQLAAEKERSKEHERKLVSIDGQIEDLKQGILDTKRMADALTEHNAMLQAENDELQLQADSTWAKLIAHQDLLAALEKENLYWRNKSAIQTEDIVRRGRVRGKHDPAYRIFRTALRQNGVLRPEQIERFGKLYPSLTLSDLIPFYEEMDLQLKPELLKMEGSTEEDIARATRTATASRFHPTHEVRPTKTDSLFFHNFPKGHALKLTAESGTSQHLPPTKSTTIEGRDGPGKEK